jgi:hypothetical protein
LLFAVTATQQEELQKMEEIQPKFDTPPNKETNIKNVPDVVHGMYAFSVFFIFT